VARYRKTAEAFIGFKDAKVVNGLAPGEVEKDKGEDNLFIGPALSLHVETGSDAFPQVEDGDKIEIHGKTGEGGHAAGGFFFFVLV